MRLKALVAAAILALTLVGAEGSLAAKKKTKIKVASIGALNENDQAVVKLKLKAKGGCKKNRKYGIFPASGGPPIAIGVSTPQGKFEFLGVADFKYKITVPAFEKCKKASKKVEFSA